MFQLRVRSIEREVESGIERKHKALKRVTSPQASGLLLVLATCKKTISIMKKLNNAIIIVSNYFLLKDILHLVEVGHLGIKFFVPHIIDGTTSTSHEK